MGRLQTNWLTILLVLAAAASAGPALAESDICMRLEARLMALDSRSAGGGDTYRTHDKSIRKQRDDLDRATTEARRSGCMGSFFRRLKANASCGPIVASIDRMRANLNRLTAARDNASRDPFAGGRERSELVGALAANRCGEHYEAYDRPARRDGLFATLFGGRLFRERGWGGNDDASNFGTYRTLCVRTCDGYYFPISFSTVRSRFAADEQSCQSMCPGTDVALYIHHNPGQESEAMISLAGEPYTALPTAFRYRKEYDPACACGRIATSLLSSPIAMTDLAESFAPPGNDPWGFARTPGATDLPAGIVPVPNPKPTAGEDPETLANRAGRFVPKAIRPPDAAIAGLSADGERSVRIVGPTFFYAQ